MQINFPEEFKTIAGHTFQIFELFFEFKTTILLESE
ncbi:hypothetical protein AHMF7616_02102 [Adhaeribacter pallidiroseus]|uniref:Uncharacterized protein n=1 Tax=Adhaeribacter pallidiroseus TaxID=2072847 RepID=A0A369QJS6_9BACT|nr:hypothetical protein AHMF7616_02102 [Adhaeribacter pallidiroseus]